MIYSKFTGHSYEVLAAVNAARSHQLEAESVRLGLPPEPVDPSVALRAEIARLVRLGALSSQSASALVDVACLPVVALDRDLLVPSSAPLTTLQEVVDHWRTSPADGVAVQTGTQPSGLCLFALSGTPLALRQWFSDVGSEEVIKEEDGRILDQRRVHKGPGAYTRVAWTPPRARAGIGAVTMGMAALQRSTDELLNGRSREAAERPAFVAWAAAVAWSAQPIVDGKLPQPTNRRRLTVKSKKLPGGVEVLGDGALLPQHVLAADGWEVNASAMPTSVPDPTVPEWVVEAVGGRWVDEAFVDGVWRAAPRGRAA